VVNSLIGIGTTAWAFMAVGAISVVSGPAGWIGAATFAFAGGVGGAA
jgi:hypothetical protein